MRNLAVIFAALTLGVLQRAEAACIRGEPNRVATVTVTSCSTVAEVAKARLGNVELPWVVWHVNSIVERRRGVVIAGQATQKIYLEQYGDNDFRFLDIVASDQTAVWFVRGDSLSCQEFKPQSVVQIYATDKCCDVFPPADIPCLLGLEQAHRLGENLTRFLQSAGLR